MSDLQTEGTKQAMTKQTNKLQLRDSEITRYNISVEQTKEISAMYRKLAKELDKKIESIDPDKNVSSAIKQNYFNQLKKDLMSEIKDISSKTGTLIEDNMRKTSESVVKDNVSFLNKVGLKIEGAYSNVPTDVVSNIASGKVYEGDWSLSRALWKDIKIKQREINTIIAEGVALNKSTYDIAKDLEMYVDPNAKKPWDWNKVYPGVNKKIDYNSQRLARTLVSHAYQQSLVQTTKPNPFVTGLQWRSANVRSCEICMERDGVIYPKDALPLDHPNGMCTFLPIIPDKMEDIADRIGNWYNGEPDPELDEFAKVLGYKEPEAKVVEPESKLPEKPLFSRPWEKTDYIENNAFGIDGEEALELLNDWADGLAYDIRMGQQMGYASEEAKDIEKLIARMPGEKSTIYRGMILDDEDLAKFTKVGSSVNMKGTSSWTISDKVAKTFSKEAEQIGGLDLGLDSKNAVVVKANFSNKSDLNLPIYNLLDDFYFPQYEVLVSEKAEFVVEEVVKEDGVTIIQLGVK